MNETSERKLDIQFTAYPQVNRLLNHLVAEVQDFTEAQLGLIRVLQIGRPIGGAEPGKLLEMLIDEAGSSPTRTEDAYIMSTTRRSSSSPRQTGTLGVDGGYRGQDQWPLSAPHPTTRRTSRMFPLSWPSRPGGDIPDVYHAGIQLRGDEKIRRGTGYRSKSMLVLPMRNHGDVIIGFCSTQSPGSRDERKDPLQHGSQEMTESGLPGRVAYNNASRRPGRTPRILIRPSAAPSTKNHYTGGHIGASPIDHGHRRGISSDGTAFGDYTSRRRSCGNSGSRPAPRCGPRSARSTSWTRQTLQGICDRIDSEGPRSRSSDEPHHRRSPAAVGQ